MKLMIRHGIATTAPPDVVSPFITSLCVNCQEIPAAAAAEIVHPPVCFLYYTLAIDLCIMLPCS